MEYAHCRGGRTLGVGIAWRTGVNSCWLGGYRDRKGKDFLKTMK